MSTQQDALRNLLEEVVDAYDHDVVHARLIEQIRAALASQPAEAPAGQGEREAFDAWAKQNWFYINGTTEAREVWAAACQWTRAALAQPVQAPAAPEGYAIVPVEPTPEMIAADPYGMGYGRLQAIYRAMLAAAPSAQPKQESEE